MIRVLIIKSGHRETLCHDHGGAISLGDVLRSTVILHLFKNDHVTWLTSPEAIPLLKDNPHIDRIVTGLLPHWRFEVVVNLERDFDTSGILAAVLINPPAPTRSFTDKSWSQILYEMLGRTYRGEPYMLGYVPCKEVIYDVGLNYKIGSKFPDKHWGKWGGLEDELSGKCCVSMQPPETDLYAYIDWLDSCETVITNDSLGLHIALALGKRVIALFGPTPEGAVCGNNFTKIIAASGQIADISVYDVLLQIA